MNTEDPLPALAAILLSFLAGGLFTLAEFVLAESRKSRLRARVEGGDKRYRRALEMAEQPDAALGALSTVIVLTDVFTAALAGIFTAALWKGFAPPALAAAALTFLLMLLRNRGARLLARTNPEALLVYALPLLRLLSMILGPLLNLWEKPNRRGDPGMTEDELRIALREGEKSGLVESEERTMVEGVFYLGDRPVGAFMTHRSEIHWLDLDADAEKVRSLAVEHRSQQYFPVASGTLDEIAGIVSVQNILLALLENNWTGLKSIMDPPHFVPETMSSIRAFEAFKRGGSAFLLVIDEYGGFAGALTVRDLIEEIVGELSVSTDNEILKRDDGSYLADGGANIDDIAEILPNAGLSGSPQEYHTLAGFILELAGEIPQAGAVFERNGYRFTVMDMDGNRIDKVLIEPAEGASDS
jgi:putative hemolysin